MVDGVTSPRQPCHASRPHEAAVSHSLNSFLVTAHENHEQKKTKVFHLAKYLDINKAIMQSESKTRTQIKIIKLMHYIYIYTDKLIELRSRPIVDITATTFHTFHKYIRKLMFNKKKLKSFTKKAKKNVAVGR